MSNRSRRTLALLPVGIVCAAIGWLVVRDGQGLGSAGSRAALARDRAEAMLPIPRWKVGDWFELRVSEWRGFTTSSPPARVEWSKPVLCRYRVVKEEKHHGYPCFVVQETHLQNKRFLPGSRFFFRKSDMALVSVWRRSGTFQTKRFGTPPWRLIPEIGLVPRFPVLEGRESPLRQPMLDAQGKRLTPKTTQELVSFPQSLTQVGSLESRAWAGDLQFIRVEAEGAVCRWAPGQLWWAQCWELPRHIGNLPDVVSTFRAALYRSSGDGKVDYPLPNASAGGAIHER